MGGYGGKYRWNVQGYHKLHKSNEVFWTRNNLEMEGRFVRFLWRMM